MKQPVEVGQRFRKRAPVNRDALFRSVLAPNQEEALDLGRPPRFGDDPNPVLGL
jgi:hypothetical protein